MNLELDGKVAIVTGASMGMGEAVSERLAGENVRLCMVARNAEDLDATAKRLAAGRDDVVLSIAGDVRDAGLAARVVDEVTKRWGQIDILINNAGGPPMGSFLDHDDEAWQDAIDLNLMSVIRFCRAVVPGMQAQKWGRIVNITSTLGKEPSAPMVLSATARAGVSAFSKSIAAELAADNITINTILPGGVRTGRLESLMRQRAEADGLPFDEMFEQRQSALPMRRFAEPEEIADVITFLASARGSYVTGTSLAVDGGLTKGVF